MNLIQNILLYQKREKVNSNQEKEINNNIEEKERTNNYNNYSVKKLIGK